MKDWKSRNFSSIPRQEESRSIIETTLTLALACAGNGEVQRVVVKREAGRRIVFNWRQNMSSSRQLTANLNKYFKIGHEQVQNAI